MARVVCRVTTKLAPDAPSPRRRGRLSSDRLGKTTKLGTLFKPEMPSQLVLVSLPAPSLEVTCSFLHAARRVCACRLVLRWQFRLLGAGIATGAFLSGLSTVLSLSYFCLHSALLCCFCLLFAQPSVQQLLYLCIAPVRTVPYILMGSFFGCLVPCFLMGSLSGWCFVWLDLHGSPGADGFSCGFLGHFGNRVHEDSSLPFCLSLFVAPQRGLVCKATAPMSSS